VGSPQSARSLHVKFFDYECVSTMENIIFGVSALLSWLTTSWNNLIAFIGGILSRQFASLAKLVEPALALILWSVPLAFWTVVIRFFVKHF